MLSANIEIRNFAKKCNSSFVSNLDRKRERKHCGITWGREERQWLHEEQKIGRGRPRFRTFPSDNDN